MSTDTQQRIIVELRLHDPDENDTIHDFYCTEPQRFEEHLAAAIRDCLAAHAMASGEAAILYLYEALEDMFYHDDPLGLRAHLAAHGITPVEDQPERLVVTVDYYVTLEDAADLSTYAD